MLEVLLQNNPLIGLDLHASRFVTLSACIEAVSATLLTLSLSLVYIIARLLFILHLEAEGILVQVREVLHQFAVLSFDHSPLGFAVTWLLEVRRLSLNHLVTVGSRHEWIRRIAVICKRSNVLILALFIASGGYWCILELVSIFGME